MTNKKNAIGFLIETISPLPTKNKKINSSFGKPKKLSYMTKTQILKNFGKNKIKSSKLEKRDKTLRELMKLKNKKKITLQQAWNEIKN